MIDNWITALRSGDESTNPVASTLSELKTQLMAGNPNGEQIQTLLEDLADQTQGLAGSAEEATGRHLNTLAGSLRDFSKAIAGEAGPRPHERGQIYTQTHTGSAAGNAGAPEMGRKDGSPGDDDPGMQGGGSYGSGYGTGSDTDADAPNSGTDPQTPGTSTHEGGSQS